MADKIQASSRNYRRDKSAVFMATDLTDIFLRDSGLEAQPLEPDENWHWTGAQHRKKLRSVLVADYEDWFRWYMKWQRLNAFQILVLVNPIKRILEDEMGGYFDGLLTRLIAKPSIHKIIAVEEDRFLPLLKTWMGEGSAGSFTEFEGKFGRPQFRAAIASLLYGTHLSSTELSPAVSRTLFAKVIPSWPTQLQDFLRTPSLLHRISRWVFTAGSYANELVEGLATAEVLESREDPNQPIPVKFRQAKDRGPSELSRAWLETLVQSLLDSEGWFTMPSLYGFVQGETQKVIQDSESFPDIFNEHYNFDYPSDKHVFLPSRAAIRGIVEGLVASGRLERATWTREIGRPSTVYYRAGRLPFDAENQCGKCAFYVPLNRRCRIWWLLNQAYRHYHPRWSKDGERPLNQFEVYKMKNSWRIGPHSSACTNFLDKKKDYSLKALPTVCSICGGPVPAREAPIVACEVCRTRFVKRKQGIKVLTSYEHEFERRYRELAGVDPSSDLKRIIDERQGSAPAVIEQAIYEQRRLSSIEDPDSSPKTVMLFPGDNMLVREGRLYVFKRRSVESLPLAGSTLIDHGRVVSEEQKADLEGAGMTVRSISGPAAPGGEARVTNSYDIAPAVGRVVAEHPEFVRRMTAAMVESAMNATRRLAEVAEVRQEDIQSSMRRQELWMRLLQREPSSKFLVCEAGVMREYWDCYYKPIKAVFQRSGPRKKARFVREFVTDPAGRARGYTAVDAAINYLHQRRLFQARSTNYQLGLDLYPGEGFLHRKIWHPEGLGLVLDLIDPFKFADREKLLGAITDFSLNWRDFYSATDRQGVRFYYPKPEAVGVLEATGEAADRMRAAYGGAEVSLLEAYRNTVSDLIHNLKAGTPLSFSPFVY
jgi:hypothetical protein